MPDLTLTACGAIMAALKDDTEALRLLLDDLDTDQLRVVLHGTLTALTAAITAVGGRDAVHHAVDQLQRGTYQLAAQPPERNQS